jgi:transposase
MRYTFKQFQRDFPDDAACLNAIMTRRYGGTEIICPGCEQETRFYRMTSRRAYACQRCGHHIYPCVGTPFEKSRTPLTLWFFAMYLFTSTRHGVAAKELQRQLGVTYKTAWRMAHELRKLMAAADNLEPLSGIVEADETYIGGKRPQERRNENKTALFGMVERGGAVRAGPVKRIAQATIHPHILRNVQRGSILITDESNVYGDLQRAPYTRYSVNHSLKEYVRGQIHTNSVEGYWSRLKNSINGTHVHVSGKHLWKYTAEFSFRYNMRKQPWAMFDRLVWAFALPRLTDD